MSVNNHEGDHQNDHEAIIDRLISYFQDQKCHDTIAIDVQGFSSVTDYVIVTTAQSNTHLRGVYRNIQKLLAELDIAPTRGFSRFDQSGWIIIDCYFFVIHLMLSDVRNFYQLENMLRKGKKISIKQEEGI